MPTPIGPDKFARAAGFDPTDFVDAVRGGETEYAGLPIGDWRQNGGQYLNVPEGYARNLGFDPERSPRRNPSPVSGNALAEKVNGQFNGQAAKSAGVAAAEAAPPVSANLGGSYALGKFADTVKEQPQVMGDVADTAGFLGSLAFGYATGSGDVVKSGLIAALAFGAFKGARAWASQADRRVDMQERQQRHQIQQERQQKLPSNGQKGPKRQLEGRKPRENRDNRGVQIG